VAVSRWSVVLVSRNIDTVTHSLTHSRTVRLTLRRTQSSGRVIFQSTATPKARRQSVKNSCASGFRPSVKKPPSLKFVLNPQQYWCSFISSFSKFYWKELCASRPLYCSASASFSWLFWVLISFYELLRNITRHVIKSKIGEEKRPQSLLFRQTATGSTEIFFLEGNG